MIIDAIEHPHVAAGHQYALDVVSHKIDVCEYVRQACQRQLDEAERLIAAGYAVRVDDPVDTVTTTKRKGKANVVSSEGDGAIE